jgi:hypothetical protein
VIVANVSLLLLLLLLSVWCLDQVQFSAEDPSGEGATSVAWNDGPDEFEQLAVGGASRRVTVYTVAGATMKKVLISACSVLIGRCRLLFIDYCLPYGRLV